MFRSALLYGIFVNAIVLNISSGTKVNHALDKPIIASSIVDELKQGPGKVVDGCHDRNTLSKECCYGSAVERNPWISVDLLATLKISTIMIFGFLCPERLLYLDCPESNPLWIMLSNESLDLTNIGETMFSRYILEVYNDGVFNITLDPPVLAQYISLKKFTDGESERMVICELETFGECFDPTANEYCQYSCHCLNGTCDGPGTTCSSGLCVDGWTGDKCNEPCSQGFYGPKCEAECSTCHNRMCSITNGSCLNGCVSGGRGDMCSEVCNNGEWGPNCENQCYKCMVPCDIYTGECAHCEPGRRGRSCGKMCADGFYGDKCSLQCNENCLLNDCNHKTGNCSRGCKPGWTGPMCQYMCQNTFGNDVNRCARSCPPCGDGSCDESTGKCRDPCESGYTGINCDEDCEPYSYGINCKYQCGECAEQVPCDTVTGNCPSGCHLDFTGSTCQEMVSRDKNVLLGSSVWLIIGVLSLGVVLCIAGSIIVVVLYRRYRKQTTARRSSRRKAKQ